MHDKTLFRQRIQKSIRPIVAIVRVEQEIRHAKDAVEGNPLQQEGAFILDAGYGGDCRIIRHGDVRGARPRMSWGCSCPPH